MGELIRGGQVAGDENVSRDGVDGQLALGQWYWVTDVCRWDNDVKGMKKGDKYEWFGCVMQIGSNFVELHTPHAPGDGYSTTRVHFDEYWDRLRFEPNADAVIQEKIQHYQQESNRLLEEVRSVTARLGLKQTTALSAPNPDNQGDGQSTALATLSGQVDVKAYELALRDAKEKTLPELFKAIEVSSKQLNRWLLATTMGTQALMVPMKESIGEIENRIFNVSLYAGLTEHVVKCSDGAPADMLDKLHVMQRRLYMDEECLLNYSAGGMDFCDIRDFDAWIAKPENRDRILPFPRTLVAMRVRRHEKDRDWNGDLLQLFINIRIAAADKFTFLYIRNGDQVWRLSCEMDFGELIFPDQTLYDPAEPKMVRLFVGRVQEMISTHLFAELKAKYVEFMAKSDAWRKANPDASRIHDPYRGIGHDISIGGRSFNPEDWHPFDQSCVYFDECMAQIEGKIKEYNRIALIIQGLFDRSEVLHPHPPVTTWTHKGFRQAIKLVYDGTTTLYDGPQPDFEAYRTCCNASLNADSVVTGQEDFWLSKEAERENRRLDNDWRNTSSYRHTKFKPMGNPGPGQVARISQWKPRSRDAVFTWHREKRGEYGLARATLTVPQSALFNITAYQPGDYKQFFRDPRTRAQYLKWAPLLLAAEDYHAGKIKVREEGDQS